MPPHFDLYRQVSAQIHAVFRRYTDLIEPLSLDEAYLDVTRNFENIPYASEVAKRIRAEIFEETGLTASAGIAPNKFLAKIASDWRKPNGQFVLLPQKIMAFLESLPLGKIPGVGKVTLKKMNALGMQTAGDLRRFERGELLNHFGRYGYRLYDLARGIDERPVKAERERLQISTEITLPEDLSLEQASSHLPHLAEDLWRQIERKKRRSQRRYPQTQNPRFPHYYAFADVFFVLPRQCLAASGGAYFAATHTAATRRRLPPDRHRRKPFAAEKPAADALVIKK